MSDGTLIGWLDRPGHLPMTANVVYGCKHRSTGCDNCFAPRWVARQAHLEGRGGIVEKNEDGKLEWTGKVLAFPERVRALRTLRAPRMIFVTALGELFDPQVSDEFLTLLWETMAASPHHIYVIFTKLAKRMHDKVTALAARFGVLPNVWLGVSCENQHEANTRLPWLMRTPAAIRGVSCEPLLSPIDLRSIPYRGDTDYLVDALHRRYRNPGAPATDGWGTTPFSSGMANLGGIDWVIVGGESAPKAAARPMHPDWARSLLKQAKDARVAAFFKQWGSWGPAPWVVRVCDPQEGWKGTDEELADAKAAAEKIGATHSLPVWADQYGMMPTEASHKCWSLERHELPAGSPHAPMRFYPGKSAGHLIDGRAVQQWPTAAGRIIEADQPEQVLS
jgi:protein gp37